MYTCETPGSRREIERKLEGTLMDIAMKSAGNRWEIDRKSKISRTSDGSRWEIGIGAIVGIACKSVVHLLEINTNQQELGWESVELLWNFEDI